MQEINSQEEVRDVNQTHADTGAKARYTVIRENGKTPKWVYQEGIAAELYLKY